MEAIRIDIDTKAVDALFERLSPKKISNLSRKSFRPAATLIKSAAVRNFKRRFPGSELVGGIRTMIFRDGSGAGVGYKRVAGAGNSRRKDASVEARYWLVLPLEKGTVQRFTGAKKNRGKIAGAHFFADALQAKQQQALVKYQTTMERSIIKLAENG
jgi:hypothetical protein